MRGVAWVYPPVDMGPGFICRGLEDRVGAELTGRRLPILRRQARVATILLEAIIRPAAIILRVEIFLLRRERVVTFLREAIIHHRRLRQPRLRSQAAWC